MSEPKKLESLPSKGNGKSSDSPGATGLLLRRSAHGSIQAHTHFQGVRLPVVDSEFCSVDRAGRDRATNHKSWMIAWLCVVVWLCLAIARGLLRGCPELIRIVKERIDYGEPNWRTIARPGSNYQPRLADLSDGARRWVRVGLAYLMADSEILVVFLSRRWGESCHVSVPDMQNPGGLVDRFGQVRPIRATRKDPCSIAGDAEQTGGRWPWA